MQFSLTPELYLGLACGSVVTAIILLLLRARAQLKDVSEKSQLNAEIAAKNVQSSELQARLLQNEQKFDGLLKTNDSLSNDIATLQERIKNYELQAQQMEQIEKRFSASFDSLAARALNVSTEQFLALANQNFSVLREGAEADLSKKETAINSLVEPISHALAKVDLKLAELETARVGSASMLQENLRSLLEAHTALRSETATLSQALRSPNVRGSWGEMQLRRVIEFSGMLEYCDFETQAHTTDQETQDSIRPDVIVRLPNNRVIVIDAKTPLSAYLEAQATNDPTLKKEFLKQHAQQLRQQIRNLATKKYWAKFNQSPEFVVLFLPGEVFFSAALENDASLLEDAFQERVILATPTTLVALLKAVAYGWRTEKMTENALAIKDLAKQLVDRVGNVRDSFETLGVSLAKSSDAYNKTLKTLDEKILGPAQKIVALGAATEKNLVAPEELTATIKLPSPASLQ